MDSLIEQQLIAALTQATSIESHPQRYDSIERLFAELIGGQPSGPRAFRGPDILVRREGDILLAIELRLITPGSLARRSSNQIAGLLRAAVETRRSFQGEVSLSAVLLFTGTADENQFRYDELGLRLARRLLRSDDEMGYDSVLVGRADTQLTFRYFDALTGADEEKTAAMHSAADVLELLGKQKSAAHPTQSKKSDRRQRILMVTDEWRSGRGGLSTVNRELAAALAAAGVDVAVLVPKISDEDVRAASEVNVAIVAPARAPGLGDREALLLRPVFADKDWEPDVVVGHGRVLGPYAAAQQQQFFPKARRVHFVHTDAEQLEAAKEELGGRSNMLAADSRRNLECDLARSADLVVGIGPLLTETIRDDLIGLSPHTRVLCLIPGLRAGFDVLAAQSPVKNRVLIVGRADDFLSKGIDIAAEALLKVVDHWPSSRPHPPSLVIRGVPEEAATIIKAGLDEILERRVDYTLRPYSDSEADVTNDLAQARVLLMPSRHEGFGLAAYEAIASGLPVLISRESGLAQFLRESQIDTSPSSIVTTHNSPTHLAIDRWADAIKHVLDQPDCAREQAGALRAALASKVHWTRSAATLLRELDASE
jgi:D-inositol-3-phosphate glycosyltransferase